MVVLAFIQPLLAVEVRDILVGLVMLIIVIIRQLIEANRAAGAKRAKPPDVPEMLPQEPVKPPVPAGGQQADPLRAQVEEFLRRANRPAEQNQPARQSEPARPSEVPVNPVPVREARTIGEPLQQAAWRQTPPSAVPFSSAPTGERPRVPRSGKSRKRKSVAEHVAEQVSARAENLARHTSKLGQRIVAEDEQFDVQLKSKFDHQLGTLSSREPTSAENNEPAPHSPAAELAALLANPAGIRQAVLINEILRRPIDRW